MQAVIAEAPDNGTNDFKILIEPGVYQGQIVVPKEKRHLKFMGETAENTALTYAFNQNEPGPGNSAMKFNNAGTV